MSIHIGAKKGDIAKTVLLPGDPLRAKFVAETFLKKTSCYNNIRGMFGYTGDYEGKRISVQGTGMGIPSISIYAHELITEYKVRNLIRIGTCASIQTGMRLEDVILVQSASTDSQVNRLQFQGMDFAPSASFSLMKKTYDVAQARKIDIKVGTALSTDRFYHENPDYWKLWANYGVLALEMETSALYTLGARHNVKVLSILTVSDDLISGKKATSQQREKSFTHMIELALQVAE